jgi:hypothetical protein
VYIFRAYHWRFPAAHYLQSVARTIFTICQTKQSIKVYCLLFVYFYTVPNNLGYSNMTSRIFANFCHEIGCENDQTYIFRFVKYLSTFFYTYLPVNIHFQLIIITSVSILTDPTYFVPPSCHCGILALRSRDFWEISLHEKLENIEWEFTSIGITIEENNISGYIFHSRLTKYFISDKKIAVQNLR